MRREILLIAAILGGCAPAPSPSGSSGSSEPAATPRPTPVELTHTPIPTTSATTGVLNLYATPGATVWVRSMAAPGLPEMGFVATGEGRITGINLEAGIYQAGVRAGDRDLYATDLVLNAGDDIFVNLRALDPAIPRTCVDVDDGTCREAIDEAYKNGLLRLAPSAVVLAAEARAIDGGPCDHGFVGIVQVKFSVATGSVGVVMYRDANRTLVSCPF